MSCRSGRGLVAALCLTPMASLVAQCSFVWTGMPAGSPAPGVSASSMWDPDGPGPATPRVALGRWNPATGSAAVSTFDPMTSTWSELGPAFFGQIRCLAAMPDGSLVVGGTFAQIGWHAVHRIARWNGTEWQALGDGASGEVTALAAMPDGSVVASGRFAQLGPDVTIARWDGQSWSAIGGGNSGLYPPSSLCLLPNGDLVAGGLFSSLAGVAVRGIARWDGATWHAIGSGLPFPGSQGYPDVVKVGPTGDLYAAGRSPSFVSQLFQWNGSSWLPIGGPIGSGGTFNLIWNFAVLANGEVVAAGNFTLGGVESFTARWNGASWSAMTGSPNGAVHTLLELPNGGVLAGGQYGLSSSPFYSALTQWNGLSWQPILATGAPNGIVRSVAALPDGGFVVGGEFTLVGGLWANRIAIWRNGAWSTLGSGIGGVTTPPFVSQILVLPNGDLVAGGSFASAGGIAANNVARWDGTAWHALGGGVTGVSGSTTISGMAVMPNGDLIVAGRFYTPFPWLARWNGTSWSSIGPGWEGIEALATTPNGDLLVAYNQSSGGAVAKWNGATWTQVGTMAAATRVQALDVASDGSILVGGLSPSVAAWIGSQWTPVGVLTGEVKTVRRLANGTVLAGGAPTSAGSRVVAWRGGAWTSVGDGVSDLVEEMAVLTTGEIAVAGHFLSANSIPGAYVTTVSTTCPANAQSYGTGCSGSAGPVHLTASTWPMLGGRMRARTTGLPTNTLAVGIFGFSQISVPLSSGHPAGAPGCDVLDADEILIEFLVGAGFVDSSIQIPNDPMLVGADFHHQVVPVELDASGAVTAITSSNALTLTVGSF